MKYDIKLPSIEKKLPEGFALPTSFHEFAQACGESQYGDLGWFSIKYTRPKELMNFDPQTVVVPALRLPDGGFVAFWFCSNRAPAVVWFDSEGEAKLIGATWADFLKRLSTRKTGAPDLDDREIAKFPKIRGSSSRLVALTQKRREFKKWLKQNQPDEKTGDSNESEDLRRELFQHLKRHLEDEYDWVNLRVTLTSRSYKVDWAAGGMKPYPAAKRLRPVLDKLVVFLGRSLKKSELSVSGDGAAFVEKNICLGDKRFYKF